MTAIATLQASLVLDAQADLGESPLWSEAEQKLYWLDINAGQLHRFDPADSSDQSRAYGQAIGCIAPISAGSLLAAMRNGIYRLDLGGARPERIANAPYDPNMFRFNDGRCDRQGRFWVGTICEMRDRAAAILYRLDADGRVRRMIDDMVISNGLAWSPDGATMYHADTPACTVWAYDYDTKTGTPSNRRVFLDLTASGERPDGATVDAAGNYWLALYGAGKVVQFSPAGLRLCEIQVPARATTMPAFGGADLRRLYITTARQRHSEEDLAATPLAGGLFAADVDIPGLAETAWAPV